MAARLAAAPRGTRKHLLSHHYMWHGASSLNSASGGEEGGKYETAVETMRLPGAKLWLHKRRVKGVA